MVVLRVVVVVVVEVVVVGAGVVVVVVEVVVVVGKVEVTVDDELLEIELTKSVVLIPAVVCDGFENVDSWNDEVPLDSIISLLSCRVVSGIVESGCRSSLVV
jgi:hypothetical protein